VVQAGGRLGGAGIRVCDNVSELGGGVRVEDAQGGIAGRMVRGVVVPWEAGWWWWDRLGVKGIVGVRCSTVKRGVEGMQWECEDGSKSHGLRASPSFEFGSDGGTGVNIRMSVA